MLSYHSPSLYTGSPFSVLYHNRSIRQNTVLIAILIGGIKKEIEVELGKRSSSESDDGEYESLYREVT